jgi:hypothetical protein
MPLTAPEIRRRFDQLNAALRATDTRAELYVVGGAVMCLAYGVRESTQDVDALFKPTTRVREAAARVAAETGAPPDWLNDSVKGYLSERGDFAPFLELDHLKVLIAEPQYLLAMKCLAMRLGAEFHDEEDVRFLLRTLNITSVDQAWHILAHYYPIERYPPKTKYVLEEMLPAPQ